MSVWLEGSWVKIQMKQSLFFGTRHDDAWQLHILAYKLREEENGLRASESILLFLSFNHLEDIRSLQLLIRLLIRVHYNYTSSILRNNLWNVFLWFSIANMEHSANKEVSSVFAILVVDYECFVVLVPGFEGTELYHWDWWILCFVYLSDGEQLLLLWWSCGANLYWSSFCLFLFYVTVFLFLLIFLIGFVLLFLFLVNWD